MRNSNTLGFSDDCRFAKMNYQSPIKQETIVSVDNLTSLTYLQNCGSFDSLSVNGLTMIADDYKVDDRTIHFRQPLMANDIVRLHTHEIERRWNNDEMANKQKSYELHLQKWKDVSTHETDLRFYENDLSIPD